MLAGKEVKRVAIIGGNRIPFARSNTAYSGVSNKEMLVAALNGLADRFNLEGEKIDEVAGGAVMKHSRDFNMVRDCVLESKLASESSAYDLQQACGTGLEAAILLANKIALGQIDCAVSCGVDTTSDAPLGINDEARKIFMKLNVAKTAGEKAKLALKLANPKFLVPDIPKNSEALTGLSMGEHQAITAAEWNIPREEQDKLTLHSHLNLAQSYEDGWQDDLVTPFHGLERDNNMRAGSTLEKLASLKPVFGGEDGTMTAGNSTPLTDGASALLLASEDWAKAHKLPVLAYITLGQAAAVDFVEKKEGLLMAPAYAISNLVDKAGITLQDFDFYEIHEAFASQVLAQLKAMEDDTFCKERLGRKKALGSIDRSKLNVKGSSLAAGHPFAATGSRILANAAKMLNEKGSGRCLISICAAGGNGVVAIVEK